MLQRRLLKSSANTSKRLNRRARISFDTVKAKSKKFLPFVLLLPLLLLLNGLFTIKKIDCFLNNEPCPKEIATVVNKLLDSNPLFVNQKELFVFIKSVYPVDKISTSYHAFNTLKINLQGTSPFISADILLVGELPALSMDQAPSSSDSAGWWVKPTGELQTFVASNQALGFNLWENGTMTPLATSGANIKYIFTNKPSPEIITSVFNLIKIIQKYLDVSTIYIVNQRVFLSRTDQPDIIIGVPFEEGSLVPALQSISYLSTIKKDVKVIDLSFKNPILR